MTPYMKAQMEKTELFQVDVLTTPPRAPRAPRNLTESQKVKAAEAAKKIREEFQTRWDAFRPSFKEYDVIVSNYNGEEWPKPVQRAFEKYMKSGGRFIVVHAADNSFPNWLEYNKMIGLGGWGGRNEKNGPYVYYGDDGKIVRNTQPGGGGSHGPQHAFKIVVRDRLAPGHQEYAGRMDARAGRTVRLTPWPSRKHECAGHRLQLTRASGTSR